MKKKTKTEVCLVPETKNFSFVRKTVLKTGSRSCWRTRRVLGSGRECIVRVMVQTHNTKPCEVFSQLNVSPVRSGSTPRSLMALEFQNRLLTNTLEASTGEHQVREAGLQPVPGDHLTEFWGPVVRELEVGPNADLAVARVQIFVHQGQT